MILAITLGELAGAVAVMIGALGAVYKSLTNKVQEVHVLVNSQLNDIRRDLTIMTKERDDLVKADEKRIEKEGPNA